MERKTEAPRTIARGDLSSSKENVSVAVRSGEAKSSHASRAIREQLFEPELMAGIGRGEQAAPALYIAPAGQLCLGGPVRPSYGERMIDDPPCLMIHVEQIGKASWRQRVFRYV